MLLTTATARAQSGLVFEKSIKVLVQSEFGGSGTVSVSYVNSSGTSVTEDYSNGGTVSTSNYESGFTLTITPAAGCELSAFYRTQDGNGTDLSATENNGVYTYHGSFPANQAL